MKQQHDIIQMYFTALKILIEMKEKARKIEYTNICMTINRRLFIRKSIVRKLF